LLLNNERCTYKLQPLAALALFRHPRIQAGIASAELDAEAAADEDEAVMADGDMDAGMASRRKNRVGAATTEVARTARTIGKCMVGD
jgi:hypothetical protein